MQKKHKKKEKKRYTYKPQNFLKEKAVFKADFSHARLIREHLHIDIPIEGRKKKTTTRRTRIKRKKKKRIKTKKKEIKKKIERKE